MRRISNSIKAVLLLGMAGLLSVSCVKYKHDPVPDHSGEGWAPENARIMTVEELKGRFPGTFDSVGQFMEVVSVTDSLTGLTRMDTVYKDIYLHVVVIGNDISGNLYKSMYVRDISQPGMEDMTNAATRGQALNIAVDKTGLYNFYPVGQELYIKCSGLYFGRYENLPQLGYRYADDNGIVDLGRIPDVVFTQHVTKTGLPPVDSADLPQPIEITDAAQLEDPLLYNQLVILRNVQFAGDEVGEEFAPAPPVGTNPTSTNRYFTLNEVNAELVLRTSSACRFFREPVPAGTGDMTCIFAIYDDTKQFYLRSYSDLDTAKFNATSEKNYPIFYASFANGISKFRIVNVLGDATWTHHGSYGGGCAMLRGNRDARANEDWLISDTIEVPADRFDLVTLAFDQALSYKFDSPDDYYTVRVSENYDPSQHSNPNEAEWTTLTIPSPHPGDNFEFESSGNIDMRAYKGKTIRIAFVYKSDDKYMATWEINRIRLLGNN